MPSREINPFTAMMSFETAIKVRNFKPLTFFFFFFFLHWQVKGFLSKCTALKIDVIRPENILFAGSSVHLLARTFYRLGPQ